MNIEGANVDNFLSEMFSGDGLGDETQETPGAEQNAGAQETPGAEQNAGAQETPGAEQNAGAQETPGAEQSAGAQETPGAEQGDMSKFLNEHFPGVENVDVLKSTFSRAKLAEKELADLRAEVEKHETSLRQLVDSGINPTYLRLQKLENEKSPMLDVYKQLQFGQLSDMDLVKLSLLSEYPELKDDAEMLQFKLEEKYPLLYDDDVDKESPEYLKNVKRMKFDAMQAKKKLNSEFEGVDVPTVMNPDKVHENQINTLNTWKDFNFKTGELTKVDVFLPGEKDTVKFMDIKIPEKEYPGYVRAALNLIASQGLEYSTKNIDKVKNYVQGLYLSNNLLQYNKLLLEKRSQMSDSEWRSFLHNPKPVSKSPGRDGGKTSLDDFVDLLDL